jgi:Ca2+-binding EF-hand superfamily protein
VLYYTTTCCVFADGDTSLEEAFGELDSDGSGSITTKELEDGLRQLGALKQLQVMQ